MSTGSVARTFRTALVGSAPHLPIAGPSSARLAARPMLAPCTCNQKRWSSHPVQKPGKHNSVAVGARAATPARL